MASLSPPFILCPLSDRKSLLGIQPDRESNKAIITFGRNIAIRYHIPEQKQECSWTTSRYWFTSPVVYCHDYGKYGAVLNNNIIALWDEEDSSLSKMNKLKLSENVLGIHSAQRGRTMLVMKNGYVAYLSDITEDKKCVKTNRLGSGETLISFEVDEKYCHCYMASSESIPESGEELTISVVNLKSKDSLKRCKISSNKQEIMGYCLSAKDSSDSFIAYLGSDGCIYKRQLTPEMEEKECLKLANLTKFISNKSPVVMCPLPDNSCIAMYGSDPSEEGAVVIIYDIHYDLVVSKQSLKLYSIPPLMERIGNSLFVPLGLHILVLNFRVTKSLLSSVVGKHQAKLNEEVFEGRNPWTSTGWDTTTPIFLNENFASKNDSQRDKLDGLKKRYPEIWDTIQQVKIFESEGQPEAVICNHVIPMALENENCLALDWILDTFLDIPEVHIVSMVVFTLRNVEESADDSNGRLNKLLQRKFDKNLLTMSLRHVAYDDIKKIIDYINNLIRNQWQFDVDSEEESPMQCWLSWCSALIDAHYTKFVLHSDTGVIENILDSVAECTQIMKDVEELEPFLLMTYSKTIFEPAPDMLKRWRTETVTFE